MPFKRHAMSFLKVCLIFNFYFSFYAAGFDLTILHTNDVHARFEQFNKYGSECTESDALAGKCFGGVARRHTKIQEIRGSHDNVLLLDAGDQFMGTTWFNVHRGRAAAYFMEKLGYDVMCFGNHEFDLGVEGAQQFLNNITSFPVVSANTDVTNEPRLQGKFLKSWTTTVGGETIGIVGYITPETSQISNAGSTVVFTDIIQNVTFEVENFRDKGINKIIALGHAGFSVDKQVAEILGVDLVIGGHTNTFLYNGEQPSNEEIEGPYPVVVRKPGGESTGLVVQDYTMAKYLGYLKLTFDENGIVTNYSGNPILLDASVVEDADILKEVAEWRKPVDALSLQRVGYSNVVLDGERSSCRLVECNLGNLVTDAMIDYHVNFSHPVTQWAPAAIAVWNGGGIRSSIDKGVVSAGEVISVLPFGNEIDLVTLSGKNIREQLEISVQAYDRKEPHGRFLQMSGLRVGYNLQNSVGNRVVSVEARCLECSVPKYSPLSDTDNYKVFASPFIIEGGDGYKFQPVARQRFNTLDVNTLTDYFKKHSPVYADVNGRISFQQDQTTSGSSTTSWTSLTSLTFIISLLALRDSFFV